MYERMYERMRTRTNDLLIFVILPPRGYLVYNDLISRTIILSAFHHNDASFTLPLFILSISSLIWETIVKTGNKISLIFNLYLRTVESKEKAEIKLCQHNP